MRQIGLLPKGNDPKVFADYLLTLGIKTRVDDRPDGWHLWIYDEDQVARASEELREYLARPDDPRFQTAVDTALAIRRQEQARDKAFRKNYREVSDLWASPGFSQRPLTIALIAACVIIFLIESQSGIRIKQYLWFATLRIDQGHLRDNGFDDILHGEIWRLVTPVFMHVNALHIFFNMWWLLDLGTLIEVRRGAWRLATIILISAIISNFAQFLWMERIDPGEPRLFEGMSGVVYALFGYLWMKGLYQPEQRMALHPNTITIMLLWLVLCMTGAMGPIANAAHFAGLVVGVAFGVLRF